MTCETDMKQGIKQMVKRPTKRARKEMKNVPEPMC
jgi:hypothetical protein